MGKPFLHRLHAKEYAGSWKNPFFADPQARERSRERLRYGLYTVLVGVSMSTCLSLLFWFGTQEKFAITRIRVEGMRSIPNEKIAQEALHLLADCEAWFSPCLYTWNSAQEETLSTLKNKYALEEAGGTVLEQELVIRVREAVVFIPLRIGPQLWFASQGGVLQKEATPEDIAAGILIPPEVYSEIDVSEAVHETPAPGLQVRTPEVFSDIAGYKEAFTEWGMVITSFQVTKDVGKVIAHTKQGFAVFFTPWEDARVQVKRLAEVLKETTPEHYADIRFQERIYIK